MSNSADRVDAIDAIQRRRRYTANQKVAVVQEAAQPGMTIASVARRHGIAPSLIFGWRRRITESQGKTMRPDHEVAAMAEILELRKQVRELQRVLGKKTLETEILRETVKLARNKGLISRLPSLLDGEEFDLARGGGV
jgi:transposase